MGLRIEGLWDIEGEGDSASLDSARLAAAQFLQLKSFHCSLKGFGFSMWRLPNSESSRRRDTLTKPPAPTSGGLPNRARTRQLLPLPARPVMTPMQKLGISGSLSTRCTERPPHGFASPHFQTATLRTLGIPVWPPNPALPVRRPFGAA